MRNIFIFLFALLLCGCRHSDSTFVSSNQIPDSSELIDVTEAMFHPEGTKESTFDSVRLIFLETNERSILSELREINLVNNRIIIQDRLQRGSVAIFDTAGKFIKRLPFGKGPDEIGLAHNIFCTDEFLFVRDYAGNKISKFSLDGQFVSSQYIKVMFEGFAYVNDDLFIISEPGQNAFDSFLLVKYDSIPDNRRVWDLGPGKFTSLSKVSYFQCCKDAIYITKPWDENVYCLKDGAVFKKNSFANKSADVDFSKYSGVVDMLKRLPDDDFVHTGNVLESADLQYFTYATYRYRIKEVFRNKRTGRVWTYNFTDNSLLNLITFVGVADYRTNTFLGLIPSEVLLTENPEYRWDGSNPSNLISDADMEKLRSVKPDDNPIIVLFKLKSEI